MISSEDLLRYANDRFLLPHSNKMCPPCAPDMYTLCHLHHLKTFQLVVSPEWPTLSTILQPIGQQKPAD